MATRRIVMIEATHKIALLYRPLPIAIVAKVKPTFGKIIEKDTRVKGIVRSAIKVLMSAMLNHQKASDQRKIPKPNATICRTSAAIGC